MKRVKVTIRCCHTDFKMIRHWWYRIECIHCGKKFTHVPLDGVTWKRVEPLDIK